jgi:predicted ATPase
MLKSFEIENFKAFGERVHIPLAPITLILGPNSAGKSSIMQCLYYFMQEMGVTTVSAYDDPIQSDRIKGLKRGNLTDNVFGNDVKREMKFKFTLDLSNYVSKKKELARKRADHIHISADEKKESIREIFKEDLLDLGNEVSIEYKFGPYPRLTGEMGINGEFLCTEVSDFTEISLYADKATVPLVTYEITFERYNEWVAKEINDKLLNIAIAEHHKNNIAIIINGLNKQKNKLPDFEKLLHIEEEWIARHLPEGCKVDPNSIEFDYNVLGLEYWNFYEALYSDVYGKDLSRELYSAHNIEKLIKYYSDPALSLDDILARINAQTQIWSQLEMDEQYIILPRASNFTRTECYVDRFIEFFLYSPLRSHGFMINYGNYLIQASRELKKCFHEFIPVAPMRLEAKKYYEVEWDGSSDIGYRGENLPKLIGTTANYPNNALLRNINYWFKRLDMGYEIIVRSLTEGKPSLIEIRLKDLKAFNEGNDIEINLADCGYGIAQLLPIIAQSQLPGNKCMMIEQPETHIHPRLQADLGDLFASSDRIMDGMTEFELLRELSGGNDEPKEGTWGYKSPGPHLPIGRYLIETHSEHLVLRLQKLIRKKVLHRDGLAILYVEKTPTGSTVTQLRLDEDGDFIDEWPGGFFPERLKELI